MIRWLQDNPIGIGLAALTGVLLLAMLVLGVVSLLPVDRGSGSSADTEGEDVLALPELEESPPVDEFYVITERPLFNQSRQPELVTADPEDDLPPPDEDVERPDVVLSGVVITPSLRMAMLRQKDGDRSLVAFEGRPIEGEFGSWQVSRVDAREVVLTSGSGEELALQLKVHDEQIEPPARPPPRTEPEPQVAEDAADEQPVEGERLSRAEEIRRRIAERREELRQQAEAEEQAGEESATPNYTETIRSMIGRNRRSDGDNQEEQ